MAGYWLKPNLCVTCHIFLTDAKAWESHQLFIFFPLDFSTRRETHWSVANINKEAILSHLSGYNGHSLPVHCVVTDSPHPSKIRLTAKTNIRLNKNYIVVLVVK